MLAAWAWTLFRLYRDVKHSRKLLPDKNIFILHGSLLTAFLVIYLVQTVTLQIGEKKPSGSNSQLVLYGIVDLLGLISNCVEMATFYLVVFLMLRVTETAKARHIALQKFLLSGFVNPKELEAAVFAQHPDMPEEVKGNVRHDCRWLGSFVANDSVTGSIVSGMVEIPNLHEYAYMGQFNRWKYNTTTTTVDLSLGNS